MPSFKSNKLKNKETSKEFKTNSFKNKNNDNGDSDKYVSAAKGYNPGKEYQKHLFKAHQEEIVKNPEPTKDVIPTKAPYDVKSVISYPSSGQRMSEYQKEIYKSASTSARQKQIIDYRKKSLTLKKKSD